MLAGAWDDEQVAMLMATLDEIPTMPKLMGKLMHNWVTGEPKHLAALLAAEIGETNSVFIDRLL